MLQVAVRNGCGEWVIEPMELVMQESEDKGRKRYGQAMIVCHQGDIADVEVDAVIVPINTMGVYESGVAAVVRSCAGTMFQDQATAAMPLFDGKVIVAGKTAQHRGAFGDVVFVVDGLHDPVELVVERALKAASDAGYKTVSLPAIRTGVMLGAAEPDAESAVRGIMRGVKSYLDSSPFNVIKEIHFVVYRDPKLIGAFQAHEMPEA